MESLKKGAYLMRESEFGRGAFSTVHLARNLSSPGGRQLVAVKRINKIKHKDIIDKFDTEIAVQSSLINQHVVRLVDHFVDDKFMYIVTELCEFGDLEEFVNLFPQKTLPEEVARVFSFEILLGFLALVDQKFIHRDMKLSNIFVSREFDCKIADFGLAKPSSDISQTIAGTPITMAPEILFSDCDPYNELCDVWSFGCIVYAMTHGRYPFLPTSGGRAQLEVLVRRCQIDFKPEISADCRGFIAKMLRVNPKERLTWQDMFQEPWFVECTTVSKRAVIEKHLKQLQPKEMHLNNYFALQFGLHLRFYVRERLDVVQEAVKKLLELAERLKEVQVCYLLTLYVAAMNNASFGFEAAPGEVVQLPIAAVKEESSNEFLSGTQLERANNIVQRSHVDVGQVLQSLNTSALELIEKSNENQKLKPLASALIDYLCDDNLSACFTVSLHSKHEDEARELLNISISQAYCKCNVQEIQEYYPEIVHSSTKKIYFDSNTKNAFNNPDDLKLLKAIFSL